MTLRREGLAAHLTVTQAGVDAGVLREDSGAEVGAEVGADAGGREEDGRRVGGGASTDAADGSTSLGVGDNAAASVGGGGGAAGGGGGGGLFGVKPTGKLPPPVHCILFTCTPIVYACTYSSVLVLHCIGDF